MPSFFIGVLWLLLCLAPPGISWAAGPPPKVVVSLKPLHSLVSGVMQGIASPRLLIEGADSPHSYSLRPSQARALAEADLIVWVGTGLESFLEKPLQTLGSNAQQLELAVQLRKQLLSQPSDEGRGWDTHGEENEQRRNQGRDQRQNHRAHMQNLHIWLSPLLAQDIVHLISDQLVRMDPARQAAYEANATSLIKRLEQLHQRLQAQLEAVKNIPYIVFHDAYHYFETTYGLQMVGSLAIDPERQPGAKRILEIRQTIKELKARCLFSEPQFKSRLLATISEGLEIRTGTLDPLGAALPPGPDAYFQLMKRLGDNLRTGLAEAP